MNNKIVSSIVCEVVYEIYLMRYFIIFEFCYKPFIRMEGFKEKFI